jgi:hypothetical protein
LELGELSGNDGERFAGGLNYNRELNRNVAYYRMDTGHPGGLQVVGRTLVTVAEFDYVAGEAAAVFYDVSNPAGKSESDALISGSPKA